MDSRTWAAVAAIGSLLAGVAAVGGLIMSNNAGSSDNPKRASVAVFKDACWERLRPTVGEADEKDVRKLCDCTSEKLSQNYEADTIRGVADWLSAVQLGGGVRDAEEAYFAEKTLTERRRVEGAYDFALRQCNPALR